MSEQLDTRDLQEELEELEEGKAQYILEHTNTDGEPISWGELAEEQAEAEKEWEDSESGQKLKELEELKSEVGDEWQYGVQLVPESDFKDHAQQLAEDIGAISSDATWPLNCIDWESAAEELKVDYSSVTFRGTDYLFRA